MARHPQKSGQSEAKLKRRPALSPEARESQLIAYAVDLVEKRLIEGTASAQEVVHFLRLGSTKARLEQDILSQQRELMEAKTDAIRSAKRVEELYADALAAMRTYSGLGGSDDD